VARIVPGDFKSCERLVLVGLTLVAAASLTNLWILHVLIPAFADVLRHPRFGANISDKTVIRSVLGVLTIVGAAMALAGFFCAMLHARRTAQRAGLTGYAWRFDWTVSAFFVPLLNLYRPWVGFAELRRSVFMAVKTRERGKKWNKLGDVSLATIGIAVILAPGITLEILYNVLNWVPQPQTPAQAYVEIRQTFNHVAVNLAFLVLQIGAAFVYLATLAPRLKELAALPAERAFSLTPDVDSGALETEIAPTTKHHRSKKTGRSMSVIGEGNLKSQGFLIPGGFALFVVSVLVQVLLIGHVQGALEAVHFHPDKPGDIADITLPMIAASAAAAIGILAVLAGFFRSIVQARRDAETAGLAGYQYDIRETLWSALIPFYNFYRPWVGLSELRRSIFVAVDMRQKGKRWNKYGDVSTATIGLAVVLLIALAAEIVVVAIADRHRARNPGDAYDLLGEARTRILICAVFFAAQFGALYAYIVTLGRQVAELNRLSAEGALAPPPR
jgi:hypothetical protein